MKLRDFICAVKCASHITVLDAQARVEIPEGKKTEYISFTWTGTKTGTIFIGHIDQTSLNEGKKIDSNSYGVQLFWIKNKKKVYQDGITPISFWNKLEMPL